MHFSIEVTTEQHQHLKAAAAFNGESINEYILKRTLPVQNKSVTLKESKELDNFFKPRIETAKKGLFSHKTVDDIFDSVLKETPIIIGIIHEQRDLVSRLSERLLSKS